MLLVRIRKRFSYFGHVMRHWDLFYHIFCLASRLLWFAVLTVMVEMLARAE